MAQEQFWESIYGEIKGINGQIEKLYLLLAQESNRKIELIAKGQRVSSNIDEKEKLLACVNKLEDDILILHRKINIVV